MNGIFSTCTVSMQETVLLKDVSVQCISKWQCSSGTLK